MPIGSMMIAAISPWNFPLAIPLGGVLAALAAGNVVVLKPAPETPLVAALATRICLSAGVPPKVLQMVLCRDEDAPILTKDRRVQAAILTGATSTAGSILKVRPALPLFAETGHFYSSSFQHP